MAGAGPSRHVLSSAVHDADSMATSATRSSRRNSRAERPWPPRLYLAIDCGGTKSAAAICDEVGDIVGRGHGGPSNYTDNGLGPFLASVEAAVKNALQDMHSRYKNATFTFDGARVSFADAASRPKILSEGDVTIADTLAAIRPTALPPTAPSLTLEAAWLGIAGVDSPTDVATLSPHVGAMLAMPYPSPRLVVANDTSLLASPIADTLRPEIKSGVVVIAGTGSIVMSFRRRRNGMLKVLGRVGGFGWLLGDEGSGYAVGRNAVRRVLDVADQERLAVARSQSLKDDDADSDSDQDEAVATTSEALRRQDTSSSSAHNATDGSGDDAHLFSFDEGKAQQSKASTSQSNGHGRRLNFISKLPPSPPPSAGASEVGAATHGSDGSSRPYGHALRDRILQHWGIASTDELLRAVYDDDHRPGQDAHVAARQNDQLPHAELPLGDANLLSRSDHTLTDDTVAPMTAQMQATSLLAMPEAKASASLLPPSAVMLNVEACVDATSPIPSLSSSPAGSSTGASEADSSGRSNIASASASPRFRPVGAASLHAGQSRPVQAYRRDVHDNGSLADTDATSAASSLGAGTHDSINARPTHLLKHANSERRRAAKAERKHRLAALAPIVFHLAFTHDDAMSLNILRAQAHAISLQIREILQPGRHALAHLEPGTSVLCLGGSLVGVERYRNLIVEELAQLGVRFARLEYVGDAARRGAVALSHVLEGRRPQQPESSHEQEHQPKDNIYSIGSNGQGRSKPLPAVPTAIASRSSSVDVP